MDKKIYFLADAHLGSKSHNDSFETERKLCRWLDFARQDAQAIYLMGDIFDYWYEYRYVVPKGFTRVLGKLAEVTDSGVEVHFFIGNHDIWLTDYLSEECGLILHFEPFITEIEGKKFFFLLTAMGWGITPGRFACLEKCSTANSSGDVFRLFTQGGPYRWHMPGRIAAASTAECSPTWARKGESCQLCKTETE